jgi:integrase
MAGPRTRKRPYLVGKPRPGGQRPWRVTAYAPTTAHPHGRVRYKDPDSGTWAFRVPDPSVERPLTTLFETVERAFDARVALGRGGGRTMQALADRYIGWLRSEGRADSYLQKVENILSCRVLNHELPAGGLFAALPVSEWSPEHTSAVIAKARAAQLSDQRVEDIGVAMSGLRRTAHRKFQGQRWLALDDNPMEGVRYGRAGKVAGQHRNFVPPSARPSEAQVTAAVEAARQRGIAIDCPWLPLMVQIATRCGLRLGELLALRGVDIDLKAHQISVNGAWCQPRASKLPYRKTTKTGESRLVPYPGSLAKALADRVAQLDEPGDWLLPRPGTGQPWTREAWNDEWHRIRRGSGVWPKLIPFRNARHHTATWWHGLGFPWVDVAAWLGHDVQTCLDHYVRPADDALAVARGVLDGI